MSTRLAGSCEELRSRFLALTDRKSVAQLLEVPDEKLVFYLYQMGRYRYQNFEIRKRSGAIRLLSKPAPGLKIIQQKLNQVLQCVYNPRPSVQGFVQGRSIATNALLHERPDQVLNIDLEDFFPSIHFGRVRGMFLAPPYNLPRAVATAIAQICCHEGVIPQGAPTSPVISNMICSKLDSQLQRLARRKRSVYSRYADDITFSISGSILPAALARWDESVEPPELKLGDELQAVIADNGFRINQSKVRLENRARRQEVSGLIVNEFVNVPRAFVRQLSAMLNAWEVYGLQNAEREFHTRFDVKNRAPFKPRPKFNQVVKGKLDYLGMVRGNDDRLYRKYLAWYARLDTDYRGRPAALTRPNHLQRFEDAIMVLEDENTCVQGTGFFLKGYGLVTCEHVLTPDTVAFHISRPEVKYPLRVIASDPVVDLAAVEVIGWRGHSLRASQRPIPKRGDLVTVAGFPAYGPGATLWVSQGTVAGHRERIGRPRIQVTVPIVGGASGAPVLDAYKRVLGVAATGATLPEDTHRVVDYGVIPINSLQHLNLPAAP